MDIVFHKVRDILSEKFCFHKNQIQLETELELELGMDSREMIEFLNELEIVFAIEIDLDDIDKMVAEGKTIVIKDVIKYIEEKQLPNSDFFINQNSVIVFAAPAEVEFSIISLLTN